jgi:hypothetical protein
LLGQFVKLNRPLGATSATATASWSGARAAGIRSLNLDIFVYSTVMHTWRVPRDEVDRAYVMLAHARRNRPRMAGSSTLSSLRRSTIKVGKATSQVGDANIESHADRI